MNNNKNKVIECVQIATKIKEECKNEVEQLNNAPHLVVVIVGDDKASQVYVRNKEKVCNEVGIKSTVIRLSGDTTQDELENTIHQLNNDNNVHGILVQLPLPKHLNEQPVIELIAPNKDVDGLTTTNVGLLNQGRIHEAIVPCTPSGVMYMIDELGYDLTGKHVCVIGRSQLFGLPMAQLCQQRNATVTICHSRTKELKFHTINADVVICAIGSPKFINREHLMDCELVVDVGINRDENNKLCGDVDLEDVLNKVQMITPVPKGVGVLTTAMLLKNVIKCYKLQNIK